MRCSGSYRYRQTASPGRAGFQRGANPYANRTAYSSYYESASYEQGYSSRRGGFGFSFRVAHPGKFYRAFVDSGSLLITAVLAGLALAGIVVVEPIFSSVWEERNRGKLFKHIEGDVIERHRAQLAEIRAQRALMAQRKRGGEAAPPGAGFAAQGLVDHGGAQEEGLVQHGAHEGALMPVTPAQRAPASFDEGQGGRERSVEVHGLSNSAGTPAALPP